MNYETPDKDLASADWLKSVWELPPYKSEAFFLLFPDLDKFRKLPVYLAAVESGLILDDEWLGDWVIEPKGKTYDYGKAQKGCGCLHHPADLSVLAKAASMPPNKRYVLEHEKAVASKIEKLFEAMRKKVQAAVEKHLPSTKKADLSALLRKAEPTVEEIVQAIMAEVGMDGFSTGLVNKLSPDLEAAFKAGGLSGLQAVGMQDDKSIVELVPEEAVQFSKTRAAELVGMKWDSEEGKFIENPNPAWSVTKTTREGVRSLVEDAVSDGWSAQELKARLLEEHFFSKARAETIARTELAFAHTQGNMTMWKATGRVGGKMSILADTHPDEDECDLNAEAGTVGIDDLFPSGDDAPPYHPNCLCAVVPVLKSEMEAD